MKLSSLKSLFIFFGKHDLYDSYKPVSAQDEKRQEALETALEKQVIGELYDSAARGKVWGRYHSESKREEIENPGLGPDGSQIWSPISETWTLILLWK